MASNGVFGQNLFGTKNDARNPNEYPVWRYFLSALVLVLGCIYAAPNLYQPDRAVAIQRDNSELSIGTRFLDSAAEYIEGQGIEVKGTEITDKGGLVRITNDADQLRAQSLLDARLNPTGQDRQFVTALSLAPTTPQWLRDLGAKPMTLGLDLSGGIHFVLQVDMDAAKQKQLEDEATRATEILLEERIRYVSNNKPADYVDGSSLRLEFSTEELRDQAQTRLTEEFGLPDYRMSSVDVGGRSALTITVEEARLREIEDVAIEQNLTGLRSRVNELGVAEPLVQKLGRSRIVIDLPGVQDSSEAKRLLDKFATLDFRLVAKSTDRPSQVEVMNYEGRQVRLQTSSIVKGDNVTNALQDRDPESGLPQVSITLDSTGGEKMNRATAPNIGHSMAIIFVEQKPVTVARIIDGERAYVTETQSDRRLISVATIQAALGFRFRITGLTMQEAQDLALLLRAGALAAPMHIVEERTVGASLGEENIDRGITAVTVGLLLVLAFMLVYYKVFGIVANVALTMNLVVLIAVMSLLEATLTLPGIAGIVLTVGMAVDANVLIFSRIREELTRGPPGIAISGRLRSSIPDDSRCQHDHTLRSAHSAGHRQRTDRRVCRDAFHWHFDIDVHRDIRIPRPRASDLRAPQSRKGMDLMKTNIDFMGKRMIAFAVSGCCCWGRWSRWHCTGQSWTRFHRRHSDRAWLRPGDDSRSGP